MWTEPGGRSFSQFAKGPDLTETALSDWIKHADADARNGVKSELTTGEREGFAELCRKVKRLEMAREIWAAA